MTKVEAILFRCACEGLVRCVHTAANPAVPVYIPYYGEVIGRAVWQAKFCYRQARKLGLLPFADHRTREAA